MTNQSARQASVRSVTGTTGTYEEDWLALFDMRGVPAGTFGERMLGYINGQLVANHTNLPAAMHAFAVDQGAINWDSLGTFTP